jgi:colanic acid biosynthesis glycosyl transferase WcaI
VSRIHDPNRRAASSVRVQRARPQLLVLNQYYWPGLEATAQLLTELCEALASAFEVKVITGTVRDRAGTRQEIRNAVKILRLPSTTFERRRRPLRAVNYLSYVSLAAWAAFRTSRPDIVLCMTDPPFVGGVARFVARRFRAPLVVVTQDLFPEAAVALGQLRNPLVVGLLRWLTRSYLHAAHRVVAIGDTMRRRLEERRVSPERLVVIPNWVDTAVVVPRPRDNTWARNHELVDRFVVMHSGNVGYAQDLDTLIRATTLLRDLDNLVVLIIGSGSRRDALVELAQDLRADAIRFLPYQPRELLSESLSSAHIHVVGLARGLSGYVVPSRLYGVLAVGRPVIVTADAESETAQLVGRVGCGVVIPPGDPDRLASVIRDAHNGAFDLDAMGARARAYATAEADREMATDRYRSLLLEVTAG